MANIFPFDPATTHTPSIIPTSTVCVMILGTLPSSQADNNSALRLAAATTCTANENMRISYIERRMVGRGRLWRQWFIHKYFSGLQHGSKTDPMKPITNISHYLIHGFK